MAKQNVFEDRVRGCGCGVVVGGEDSGAIGGEVT